MFGIDFLIVILYFALVIGIGLYYSKEKDNTSQYFLANRNLGWFVIGASLFASNIGSEHLVGLAEGGYIRGVIESQFEILAAFCLLLLGWLFVPFYMRSGVTTMPEFLEKRFSSSARMYLSVVSIVAYVITKISVTIFAGAIVIQSLLGLDFWIGAIIVVVLTGFYTIMGGLKAVVYTDAVQMFLLIGGALLVTIFGLEEVGGWNNLSASAGDGFLSLWRSASHPEFPWTAVLFGAPILGIWYWCTDQFIVQRDFHVSNIMPTNKKLGVIDTQDATLGNPMYDLASLVDDVRVKVPAQIKNKTYQYYLKNCSIKKKQIGLLKNDFDILSIQRNLKILGIFFRLYKRDSKPAYLKYLPYTWSLIELRIKNKIFKNLELLLNKAVNRKIRKKVKFK